MADIAALKKALDDAEQAKADLLEERREKRNTMTKAQFREYNQETRQQQIDVQKAVNEAQRALHQALNNERQRILVETQSEANSGSDVA